MSKDDITLGFPRIVKKPSPKEQEELRAQLKESIQLLRESRQPCEMVREFHRTMGQPIGDKPQFIGGDRLDLRLALIEEEWYEFLEAYEDGDLANTFKEMADMIYVICGLAVEMGGDLDAVFNEVHRSNMTKVGKDGVVKYRDDGKVLKPDTYEEADIQGVLF